MNPSITLLDPPLARSQLSGVWTGSAALGSRGTAAPRPDSWANFAALRRISGQALPALALF